MAIADYAFPFGLRDVKLFPLDPATHARVGTGIDLPASRVFNFTDAEEFEELQGDDSTVASHGAGPMVEWELEGGGISLEVWKALSGGTTTTTGTTPNTSNKYSKKRTDSRPYFDVEGQAISDSGGDFHTIVYRCKADDSLEANMEHGSFTLTSASGKGYGNPVTEELYDFVHNETTTPIEV